MNEVNPANDWCQRWGDRQHTWRHRSEGGFDADRYTVEPVDELTAKRFVVQHHYSGTWVAASHRYGIYEAGALLGVMVLGIPTQQKVLTSVFPDLEPYVQSLELSRFVLLDEVPANSETWFLARGFEAAAEVGVRGIVSFADPVPRILGGRVLFGGHVGVIYKASNARYCGRATARTLAVLPDGSVVNDRSKQKVRKQERGHDHVERKLIGLGARTLRAGENPTVWLNDVLRDLTTPIRHRGNHRYVFPIGRTRTEKNRVRIGLAASPYPKEVDAA